MELDLISYADLLESIDHASKYKGKKMTRKRAT